MANYKEQELLTVVKAYFQSEPTGFRLFFRYDTQESSIYICKNNQMLMQVRLLLQKVNGKYKAYVLQGTNGKLYS